MNLGLPISRIVLLKMCSLVRGRQNDMYASQIPWQLDDGFSDMLPIMQSDIMLSAGSKILIIDAKYYEHTTQAQ